MSTNTHQIECWPAIPFVVITGGLLGLLRSLPAFLAVHVSLGAGLLADAFAGLAVIALWWTVLRRRQFNVWSAAAQLVALLAVAAVLSVILTLPIATALDPMPTRTRLGTIVGGILFLSPFFLLAGAVLIAVGRLLPGTGRPTNAPITSARTDVDPVI